MAVALASVLVLLPGCSSVSQTGPRLAAAAEAPATANARRGYEAHNSPMLAADPTEPRVVALATRTDAPDFSCSLALSGDGGRGFVPARLPPLPTGVEKCYAPEVAFDRSGVLHVLFAGLHGPGNRPAGVFLATSADRGATFAPPRQVLGPNSFQARLVVDLSSGKAGRLHVVWLAAGGDPALGSLPPTPNPIMAVHSDDGGRTFSEPVQVSEPNRRRVVAPAVAVGREGQLHVLYYDLSDDAVDYQGLEGDTWEGTWSLVLATSADGGRSFGRSVVVDDAVVPPGRVMLIFTMPPAALAADRRGRLFAAWPDARHGDPDVVLRRSPDGGRSWSAPRRLNDDPRANGRHQDLPRLAVAPGGRVDAVFYDRRDDRRNVRNHVYHTSSSDGGEQFAANRRVTSWPSDARIGQRYELVPSAKGLVEFGSRLGLLSRDEGAVVAWTDTRNSLHPRQQDVFAATLGESPPSEGRGGEGLPPRPPQLPVAMREHRFDHDATVPAGRIVLRLRNAGRADHNAVLVRLDEDQPGTLADQLRSSTRRSVETIRVMPALRPGRGTAVAVDLAPGRYGLICFVQDEDGTSHARKGMASEVRVR